MELLFDLLLFDTLANKKYILLERPPGEENTLRAGCKLSGGKKLKIYALCFQTEHLPTVMD